MPIDRKSTGQLIDELITTSIKCFMAQEVIASASDEYAGIHAKRAVKLNKRRNDLIQAIDARLDKENATVTEKTY